MNPNDFLKELNTTGISSVGETYIFGSFVKNDGTIYNDIDIYIDADELSITEIKNCLRLLPYDYTVVPQYYSPGPKPPPKPPFPKPPGTYTNNTLHVTVCKKVEAELQSFYQTMVKGKHYILNSENA